MCLGVPGKILEITPSSLGMIMGKVSFGGVAKEVCLAYTPEVEVGDYVIVHAGFALNKLNEQEAEEVFVLLREMGALDEVMQSEEVSLSTDAAAGLETA
jgi:hydrogenase expression/formation protein HypC